MPEQSPEDLVQECRTLHEEIKQIFMPDAKSDPFPQYSGFKFEMGSG